MDDLPVQTLPTNHPTKKDVLPKTYAQIILAAKWLVHFQVCPPTHSDDLCHLFCLYPSSMVTYLTMKTMPGWDTHTHTKKLISGSFRDGLNIEREREREIDHR